MQLGASQANQGTPPFWRGRLKKDGSFKEKVLLKKSFPEASCASALFIYRE